MHKAADIEDWYKGGRLLRRWSWVEIVPAELSEDGAEISPAIHGARCVADPLDRATASTEEVGGQLAVNAAVRALVHAAEPVPEPYQAPIYDEAGNLVGWETVTPEPPPLPDPVPAPVPATVTPLQARTALRLAGLVDAVDAFVAGLPDEAREAWEYALEIERRHPTIEAAAVALGLTEEEVNDLFRTAATL